MKEKIMERVYLTPRTDWPVADKEQNGIGSFIGL